MIKLLALLEKTLGKDWREVVEWMRSQNSLDAIEARLIAGDYANVIAQVEAAALRFAADTQTAYVTAGQKAAKWLDPKVPDALVRFDQTNTRAVQRAQANQLELVSGFSTEQREVTQNILVEGARAGTNPRVMARDLRDSIGLTANQEGHVRSYRRALESGDYANAMGRELRDARSDRTLRALARDGEQLDPKRIDKLAEAYRKNYVGYRAEVIARTEGLRAAHQGTEELHRQAVERGDVEADALIQTWHASNGPRTRDSHRALDGQERPMGKPFVTKDGIELRYPGDPRAPASETAQCRCSVSTSFVL